MEPAFVRWVEAIERDRWARPIIPIQIPLDRVSAPDSPAPASPCPASEPAPISPKPAHPPALLEAPRPPPRAPRVLEVKLERIGGQLVEVPVYATRKARGHEARSRMRQSRQQLVEVVRATVHGQEVEIARYAPASRAPGPPDAAPSGRDFGPGLEGFLGGLWRLSRGTTRR